MLFSEKLGGQKCADFLALRRIFGGEPESYVEMLGAPRVLKVRRSALLEAAGLRGTSPRLEGICAAAGGPLSTAWYMDWYGARPDVPNKLVKTQNLQTLVMENKSILRVDPFFPRNELSNSDADDAFQN